MNSKERVHKHVASTLINKSGSKPVVKSKVNATFLGVRFHFTKLVVKRVLDAQL